VSLLRTRHKEKNVPDLLQLRSISDTLTSSSNALTLCTQQCFHGKNRPITCPESKWYEHQYNFASLRPGANRSMARG